MIFEATVIPDIEKLERYFTGHAEETIGSSQINKTSALENCETSAIGRALAMMGIGVDESIASADEVANAVFQQKEEDVTGKPIPEMSAQDKIVMDKHAIGEIKAVEPTQNGSKTAEDGPKCPKCAGGMADNREIDGQPKKSQRFDELVAEGKTRGLYQPFYKCLNNSCDGKIWEEPLVIEEAAHKIQVDKEPVAKEELLF